MTSTKPLTASELYARLVLAAWNNRQFAHMEGVLAQAPLDGPETLPAAERERIDLIREIGQNVLAWEGSRPAKNGPNLKVALALVRHLARCHEDVDAGSSSSDATPVLVETRASVPHSRYVP